MTALWGAAIGLLAAMVGVARPILAQIDYRNLDDGRPTRVEDAYPVERYAFEAILPYQGEQEAGGVATHSVVPELSYGLLRNTQIGVKLALAVEDGLTETHAGLAGIQVFALYNLNTESPTLPALSLRVDGAFPVGSLAGNGSRVAFKGIVTRSWGRARIHLNGAYTIGADSASAVVESLPLWWAGSALDYTLFRQSILLVGEVIALQQEKGTPTEINVSAGLRYQWTPTIVLDLGLGRRLSSTGPDIAFTIGLSHAFTIAGLMPSRAR